MHNSGFRKFYWGFFFILIDFKINGFDILPDIIGYILFAVGFSILAKDSIYFVTAGKYNIPMIILSIFSIYEKPAQGNGINLGAISWLGLLLSVAGLVLNLLVVYNLFVGIKDMAEKQKKAEIYSQAGQRWHQYLILQLAALGSFLVIFIPPLAFVYIIILLVASIFLTCFIMNFMNRCDVDLPSI
jgi:hypothetical protein